MNNSPKPKIIIGTILVVACFGVAYFFTTPAWHNYTNAKDGLVRANLDNQNLNQSLAAVQDFNNQFSTHQSDVSKIDLALPASNPDLTNLLSNLSGEAQASGLVLSAFGIQTGSTGTAATPTTASPANTIQTIKVDLTASGSYESFRDFLLRLESNLRITDVDSVSLKTRDNENPQFQMSLRTYYQK